MPATIGIKMASTEKTVAVAVSATDTIGFAKPPVVAVVIKRTAELVPEMAAVAPLPAIIAITQVITGSRSETVATTTSIPAAVTKGTAIVSSALSIQGM